MMVPIRLSLSFSNRIEDVMEPWRVQVLLD